MVKVSDVDIRATNEKGIRMKYAVLTDPVNENKPDNFNVEETNLKDEIKSAFKNDISWETSNNSKTVRVWWTWENSSPSGDEEDTAIGTYGDNAPIYALTIAITAEQVISTPAP